MSADHNPYSPPTAPLGEHLVTERIQRPPAVTGAVILVLVGAAIEVFSRLRFMLRYSMGVQMAVEFAWLLILLTITLTLCFQAARRRNWARYLLLVFILLDTSGVAYTFWQSFTLAPAGLEYSPDLTILTLFVLPPVLRVAALGLLFGPARAWFRPRN